MLKTSLPPKWLWIGNSNTKPHITHFDTEFRKFVLCTKLDHFKREVENAPDNCNFLTMSGIDTLVADLGNQEDINPENLESNLDKIFGTLDSYRQQGMKIVVEPLLLWKKHPDILRRAAIGAFKAIKIKYPGILIPQKPDSLKFAPDGVHLTERAGSKLFTSMYEASINFFEPKEDSYDTATEGTESESDSSMPSGKELEIISNSTKRVNPPTTGSKSNKRVIPPTTSSNQGKKQKFTPTRTAQTGRPRPPPLVELDDERDLENQMSYNHPSFATYKDFVTLKTKVEERWSTDLYVAAGTKEDLDKIENEKNMNKIIFSGIEIHDLWAENLTWANRVEKIKEAITTLIKEIDPEGKYQLGYVRHLNFKLKGARQIVEATMGSEAEAKALRKAYGAKVKAWREANSFPEEMKGISMGPSLTLATRVRIAILHAIAKEIKDQVEQTDAWVIQHVARPVLKIEETFDDGSKSQTSLGFVQAIAYLKKQLPHSNFRTQDLFDAYSIAGTRFGQEISHYFILLNEGPARNVALARKPRKKANYKK